MKGLREAVGGSAEEDAVEAEAESVDCRCNSSEYIPAALGPRTSAKDY